MAWFEACKIEELAPGEIVQVDSDPAIALYNVDGELFATQDVCSHAESSLADGYLDGDVVECSWHMAKFCVRNGRALSLPATVDLATYPVKIVDGAVLVGLDENVTAPS